MPTNSLYGGVAETSGLYGIGAASNGTYFEWFVFQQAASAPATPTGGSWDFNTNIGTPPTGWLNAPPSAPTSLVWVSIAVVDSRSTASLTWSAPGLLTGSGLPVLSGAGAPSGGLDGQLYIDTSSSPKALYFKNSGTWVQITSSSLYAIAGANNNITSLTGVTGGIDTPTYLQLNTASTVATAPGKLQWDTAWNGPQIGMGGGTVNLQIGQEALIYAHNQTGSSLTSGQVVYVTGSQGQRLTVGLAQANSDSTSATILGMVTETIANGASGFVTVMGVVNGVNTSGVADGAVVYLSPTTPGGWTTTKPAAPNHLVQVGYVIKGGSAGSGSIYIHPQNGYELDELHDVLITNPQNGNYLKYDSSIPAWKNVAGPTGALVGTTDSQTLTNKIINGSTNDLFNIPNASLTNSTITVNGTGISLGAAGTVTAATPNALTVGAGLNATGAFTGAAPVTLSLAPVGAAGTYGNSSQVPRFTLNSTGQVTSVALQTIQIDASQVNGIGTIVADAQAAANSAAASATAATAAASSASASATAAAASATKAGTYVNLVLMGF